MEDKIYISGLLSHKTEITQFYSFDLKFLKGNKTHRISQQHFHFKNTFNWGREENSDKMKDIPG